MCLFRLRTLRREDIRFAGTVILRTGVGPPRWQGWKNRSNGSAYLMVFSSRQVNRPWSLPRPKTLALGNDKVSCGPSLRAKARSTPLRQCGSGQTAPFWAGLCYLLQERPLTCFHVSFLPGSLLSNHLGFWSGLSIGQATSKSHCFLKKQSNTQRFVLKKKSGELTGCKSSNKETHLRSYSKATLRAYKFGLTLSILHHMD